MTISTSLARSKCRSLLDISSSTKQLQQIHAQMTTNSLLRSIPDLGKLIRQYISAGVPQDSIKLFARVNLRDKFTCIYMFRACAQTAALREGMQAHAQIMKCGLDYDAAVQTTAINFYSNCKDLKLARNLFDKMPTRNPVTWNAMLNAYSANNAAKETFVLLREMLQQCVKPTERTAVALLSACSQLEDLNLGSTAHGFIYKFTHVHQDCFIGTGLVDMYSKCGSVRDAYKMFGEMSERNVLTWTTMMSGLAMHGKGYETLKLLDTMQSEGITPNVVTFTCLLSACCHAGLLEEGLKIFDAMKKQFGLKPVIQHFGCVVDLLGRAGLVEEAREVVRKMPIEPDWVVWRALLSACKVHGRVEIGEEVGKILLKMETTKKKEVDEKSCEDFVALSNVYASVERWEDVEMVRDAMKCKKVQIKPGHSSVQIA